MQIWLVVKKFEKIEEAKICVNEYTLLVGPNNCGKTYLMQLVDGVNDAWNVLIDDAVIKTLNTQRVKEYGKYTLSNDNVEEFLETVNKNLSKEKEKIVKDTFGKKIPIDDLYIDLKLESNESYEICYAENASKIWNDLKLMEGGKQLTRLTKGVHIFSIGVMVQIKKDKDTSTIVWGGINISQKGSDYAIVGIRELLQYESLFMPSSRSGLMILYREFFAKKTDEAMTFHMTKDGVTSNDAEIDNSMNLTRPMYRFLRFLQTYIENEETKKKMFEELKFFDERIIDGHILTKMQQGFAYEENESGEVVPMYLASAMINEVAPIFLSLTSMENYERLTIDEVEASLHPEKQRELVRFLNRIYNKGTRLIISTHSDTFVSRLNNLVKLSDYISCSDAEEVYKKFDISKNDLISSKELFVYEFISQKNGRSIVKERKFNKGTGYQFDLFTGSAMKIYDEAVKLEAIITHEQN